MGSNANQRIIWFLVDRGVPSNDPKKQLRGAFWAPGPHSSLKFQTDYIAVQT